MAAAAPALICVIGAACGLNIVQAAAAGLAIGGVFACMSVPRVALDRLNACESGLRDLLARLELVGAERREQMLSTVMLAREDEIGQLSRAMHDCLIRAAAAESDARRTRRTMRDAVERTTRAATARLTQESASDALTGVGNRRALDRLVSEWRAATAEAPRAAAVAMMIDIDRFKQVNDSFGHEAGDACLMFLGELLRSSVRSRDTVVRLGGDEFLVVMRGETREGAAVTAARLRSLFAQMSWAHGEAARPSLSIGIAEAALDRPDALDRAIREADAALYAAKRRGRDAVACSRVA